MSTFTDWNGPQNSNVRASDLAEFATRYATLTNELEAHLAQSTLDNNVHSSKTYVDNQITALKNTLPQSFDNYLTKADADSESGYAKKTALSAKANASDVYTRDTINTLLSNKADVSDVYSKNDTNDLLSNKADASDVYSKNDTNDLLTDLETAIDNKEYVSTKEEYITSIVGGSDIVGIYYILGMLKDKAGTAYIRLSNSKSFSAKIDFAVTTDLLKGALSVTTDCTLKGLKFKLVKNTKDSTTNVYLAIQSTEWIPSFASTDGTGKLEAITFYGGGINFIPAGSDDYVNPDRGNCTDICDCLAGPGFSFSNLGTTTLGQIYREYGNPYVTYKDLHILDALGIINQWPLFDENNIAIDVPEGYHACDGTDVLLDDDVDDEFRAKFEKYPRFDFSIIKTKNKIEYAKTSPDASSTSIAEAIAKLHHVMFYPSIEALPDDDVTNNTRAIVQIGNRFAVYVYTETDKWQIDSEGLGI